MNTSSYSPIASSTYNRWKLQFVLKSKTTKTSIQRRLWLNFIQRGLMVPVFIHSRSLLFEGNASLKCAYSGVTPLSTVFQSYHDDVWLLQGAECGLVVPIFIHIIRDFPVLLFAFMLMAVDFSRTQWGYSFHVFVYIKALSDCHEFGYDMRRVNNSSHVVRKSKRCRPMSAILVACRHISYIVEKSLRDF